MTPLPARRALASGTRTTTLAPTRLDARTHVTPVWFVLDGDDLVFSTAAHSVKGRDPRRDGHGTIALDDQGPPYSSSVVEGGARWRTDPDELLRWAPKIGARSMGDHRSTEYGRRNGVEGELLVRVSPVKLVAPDRVGE
jgi:PPOX class probable F420-dependent enzyme